LPNSNEIKAVLGLYTIYYIVSEDGSEQVAFKGDWVFETGFTLNIGDDKSILLIVEQLKVDDFSVTVDNCGISGNENKITRKFNEVNSLIKSAINVFVNTLDLKLPTPSGFDYGLKLQVEEEGLNVAVNLITQ
jgi:hypothetical protein